MKITKRNHNVLEKEGNNRLGGGGAVGDGPVGLKATEVVQTDDIVELAGGGHAADPPVEVHLLHLIPVVQGVAPELAVLGEGIGGAACHGGGSQRLVQLEQAGLGPDLHGVVGDIDELA